MSPQTNPRSPVTAWRRLAACAALLFATGVFPLAALADIKTGDKFPDMKVPGMAVLGSGDLGNTTGAVVLVDFWASWCAPCKASFPAMAKLHAEYAGRGLIIIAVSVDEKLNDAVRFAKKLAPPFLTLHDREQNLVKQVVVPTMPTSYLVGRDGTVRFVHTGYHGPASDKEIRTEIEALLNESK